MNDDSAIISPDIVLWRCANAWLRQAGSALRPVGLSYVQYVLLDGLAALGTARQVGLARRCACDPMTVSQVLRGLERRRLVRRQRDRDDPRAWAVTLTPVGEAALVRARSVVEMSIATFFAALGEERAAFTAALARLIGVKARVRVAAR
jgi:DNA-binding MarR family transcriptional regulator